MVYDIITYLCKSNELRTKLIRIILDVSAATSFLFFCLYVHFI